MAGQLKLRRGTTSQLANYIGSEGELIYDTELDRLRVHNGTTVGGKVIVGTRLVTTPINADTENTTGVRIINTVGNTNLPFDMYGVLGVYSNENFVAGALRVYQTFQPDFFNDLFFRKWDGVVWSAWDRALKVSEKNTEAFGVGQTYKDVTASRSINTVFTNSSPKPIFLAITVGISARTTAYIYCGANEATSEYSYISSGSSAATLYAIVNPSETYRLTGALNISKWRERS